MSKRPADRRTRDQVEPTRRPHNVGGSAKHPDYKMEEGNVRALFGWSPMGNEDNDNRD